MVNSNKIKGRIVELGLTNKDISFVTKLALPTISQKINNIRPMNLDEAEKIAKLLKITAEDFTKYFFAEYVA